MLLARVLLVSCPHSDNLIILTYQQLGLKTIHSFQAMKPWLSFSSILSVSGSFLEN